MKALIFVSLFFSVFIQVRARKPKDGTYTYNIVFAEWQGKSLGTTCTVQIKGDSVKVIDNGTGNLSGHKGDIIDEGMLMKYIKTGKWIIAHSPADVNAEEIGGCTAGPMIIDFKRKRVWLC